MDATLRWKRRRTSHTRNWIIWTSSSSTRLTYKNPYHNLPKTIQHLFGKNHNQRPSTIWDQSSGVHLHYFDNSKETVLNVDASSKGLWCSDLAGRQADCIRIQTTNYLWEKVCKHRKRAACNRLGAQKFHTYVYWRRVTVETDHKPWSPFSGSLWMMVLHGLQRMALKLTKYNLDVRYFPGKQQVISDCLSRAPLSDTELLSEPEDVIGVNLVEELGFESSALKRFMETSSIDETSRVVMEYVLKV